METEEIPCGTVTVTGRANVGKSTLLNALLGEKVSIITRRAQTTRYRIRGILDEPHRQIIFTDVPGIHKPHDEFGQTLNQRVYETIGKSDLLVFVFDAASGWGSGDDFVADKLQSRSAPVIVVPNKIDKISDGDLQKQVQSATEAGDWAEVIPVSATGEINLDRLLEAITERLPEGPRLYPEDSLIDRTLAFRVSEIIREKAMRDTREEVPHSIEVIVDRFEEGEDPDIQVIEATVFVERDSQKGILIGQGGDRIKRIGARAREDIEDLIESDVYLDLHVRVLENWTSDKKKIRSLEDRKAT